MVTPNVKHVRTVDPTTYPSAISAYVVWSDTAQRTAKPSTGGHIETLVNKREAKANGVNSMMKVAHKWILPEEQLLCDKDGKCFCETAGYAEQDWQFPSG